MRTEEKSLLPLAERAWALGRTSVPEGTGLRAHILFSVLAVTFHDC